MPQSQVTGKSRRRNIKNFIPAMQKSKKPEKPVKEAKNSVNITPIKIGIKNTIICLDLKAKK